MHSAVTENMIESVDMERGEAGADEEFQKIDYRTYQSQYLKYLECLGNPDECIFHFKR